MKEELKKIKGLKVLTDIDLSEYTTYKIATKGKYLCIPETMEAFIQVLAYIQKQQLPYLVLGGGSNVIFKNPVYEGIIIKLSEFDHVEINGTHIEVEAGYSTQKLALKVARLGLTGMEFAAGVPGTIGGAIYNNSGCYHSDMGYIVKRARILTPEFQIITMENRELEFHYRTSFLKQHRGYICLSAEIELEYGKKEEILELMQDRKERRIRDQPLEFPSAGSVFRNPPNMYAGKLIEDSGLKGYAVGKAKVSEKHANFIVTEQKVLGKDIIELIQKIKGRIKENYGIDLILEQEIIE